MVLVSKVKQLVNASKQMTAPDVIFELKGIEVLTLVRRLTYHDLHLRQCKKHMQVAGQTLQKIRVFFKRISPSVPFTRGFLAAQAQHFESPLW
jgi:hypothetical protein